MPRRYEIQRHTDHRTHAYRVVCGEDYYGYGLTFDGAEYLLKQLELDDAELGPPYPPYEEIVG